MSLIAYRAHSPDNLYRLCSINGHGKDAMAEALNFVFQAGQRHIALLLDLQYGLSQFPKEEGLNFARTASDCGIESCALAIIVQPEDIQDISARYTIYPEVVSRFVDLEVKIFAEEISAYKWACEQLQK